MSAVTYKSITIADFRYSTQNVVRDNSVYFILSCCVIIFFTQCSLFHVTKLAAFSTFSLCHACFPRTFIFVKIGLSSLLLHIRSHSLYFSLKLSWKVKLTQWQPSLWQSTWTCGCIKKHDDSQRKIHYLVIGYVSVNSLVSR